MSINAGKPSSPWQALLLSAACLVFFGCSGAPEDPEAALAASAATADTCTISSSGTDDVVRYLFCSIAGNRAPSPSLVAAHSDRLRRYTGTRRGLAIELFRSRYAASELSTQIEGAYLVFVGRSPDSGGMSYWTNALRDYESGDDRAVKLAEGFTLAPEFQQRLPRELLTGCSSQGLEHFRNSGIDAAAFLRDECIGWARDRRELALPSGRYTLASTLAVQPPSSLTIKTLNKTDRCSASGWGCAELFAADSFYKLYPAPKTPGSWLVEINSPNVVLDGISIHGNHVNRARAVGDRPHVTMYLLAANAENTTIRNSTIKEAVHASGFTIGASNVRVERNNIIRNGRHGMWQADGITVGDVSNLTIINNYFIDNSDVQLIFGGCRNCIIENNRFRHSESLIDGAASAEIMLQAWPGENSTSGNFTGTRVRGNSIDCSRKRLCNFGILVGTQVVSGWEDLGGDTPAFGGVISGNAVSNAIVGIALDHATGPMQVFENTVRSSGGWANYLTNPNGESSFWLWNEPIVVSPRSFASIRGKNMSDRLDFVYGTWSYKAVLSLTPGFPLPETGIALESAPNPGLYQNVHNLQPPKSNGDRVELMYLKLFGRAADPGGKQYWSAYLDRGGSISELAQVLTLQLEFTSRHPIDTMPADRLVSLMYQLLLERVPDAGGHAYWVRLLNLNAVGRRDLARHFADLPEFRSSMGL
ncbi:MAG: DUF4214 domain-containing protein [Deltaproteobacteria bacterium]|nr:DUF4214 domain-containing protein [Deltaproteobacteria bacterium]